MDLQIQWGRFRLFFWQSWSQFWHYREYNWIDFDMVKLHGEVAPYKQSIKFNLSLVGFNLSVDWFYGTYHE